VELAPIDDLTGILIAGPQALSIVQALGTSNRQAAPCSSEPQPPAPPALNLKRTFYAGKAVSLVRAHHPMATRLEVWSDAATSELLSKELHGTEVAPANPTDLEHLRILSGTPLYGIDIRNSDTAKDLPQETNQTRALHFSKGCYLGQEIVERIRSRGQVHRTFYGFLLSGELPAAGAVLRDPDAKAVGELTSVARIQLSDGPHQLALGYIRREALDKGLPLTYDGGTAKPSALPFQL
jgi:aminomethyltransferase